VYTVVRCSNCERCWGIKGNTRKCPHCGTIANDKLQIVSVADNASDLQREVAIANMPEGLRDEMREKLPRTIMIEEEPSASLLFSCIKIAVIEGVVELDRLAGALRGKGVLIDAEDVAEEAVSQGLLARNNDGSYFLLQ
jgi:hypothetical protein